MELRLLRTFLAIAEEGSVTAASRRLYTTQPAVTRQLAQLERALDSQLFERTGRGVELTGIGQRLVPEARRLLGLADAIVEGCRDDHSRLRATLHIGVPEEGIAQLTPVLIGAYRAAYPNVEVIVSPCALSQLNTFADARTSPFDAMLWGTGGAPGIRTTAVYREPTMIITSRDSDLADAERVRPEELLDRVFVDAGPIIRELASWAYLDHHRNGARPRLTAHPCDELEHVLMAAATGRGVIGMTVGTRPSLSCLPLAFVDLDDDPVAGVGVLLRAHETRQHVRALATIAEQIGRDLWHLVPHAHPPADTN